jgi:ATP-binding cassette subfamily B protein
MNEAVSIGVVVAFMAYIRMFFRPLMSLSQLNTIYESAMTGMERVYEVLDTPVEVKLDEDPIPLSSIEGRVEFQNVKFGYDTRIPVLKNINLKVRAKETIAIVGPTGAGKSTMVNLICRFYDPQEGNILIDDYDLRNVSLNDLRKQMGIILQDPFLFGTTVRENIRYGKLEATDEEVEMAAKVIGAHDFIIHLPEGYDTIVAEGATNLSMGQKQLIAFARVLVADPRILILDEATSSVDPYTELVIQRALGDLIENRTAFIIAHRLSTVREADRIIVIEGGEIVEEGSHQELMERNGLYSQLYQMQFKDIEESSN